MIDLDAVSFFPSLHRRWTVHLMFSELAIEDAPVLHRQQKFIHAHRIGVSRA